MRKQYHFRDSGRGLLAWDVDRLIALTADYPVSNVSLSEIRELDEEYWFSTGGNLPTCRAIAEHMQLVQDGDLQFPIILDSDGRLYDGMHRVVKAHLQGLKAVSAVRFFEDPAPDYIGRQPHELPY